MEPTGPEAAYDPRTNWNSNSQAFGGILSMIGQWFQSLFLNIKAMFGGSPVADAPVAPATAPSQPSGNAALGSLSAPSVPSNDKAAGKAL